MKLAVLDFQPMKNKGRSEKSKWEDFATPVTMTTLPRTNKSALHRCTTMTSVLSSLSNSSSPICSY